MLGFGASVLAGVLIDKGANEIKNYYYGR